MTGRIDVVIPHVDGRAPGYAEACTRHTGGFVPCHLRDLGELRYVLRSIERHLPWVERPVIAVQDAGHLPGWLATDRVRVIPHDAFVPEPHRPTFHWATIAAHLFRIPDLAERFVIWEDDTLAGRDVAPSDLFGADGLPRLPPLAPIVPGLERWLGTYQRNLTWSRALLVRAGVPHAAAGCFLVAHQPIPGTRAGWAELHARLSGDAVFQGTVTRRSRGDADQSTIDPLVVYANWVELAQRRRGALGRHLECGSRALARLVPGRAPHFGSYPLVNDPARTARRMLRLGRERPRFFNVNDDAYDAHRDADGTDWSRADRPNPRALAHLMATLETLFPTPSRFEQ